MIKVVDGLKNPKISLHERLAIVEAIHCATSISKTT